MKETVEAPNGKTFLLALERLRDIGARINRLGHDDPDVLDTTLRLIVEGAAALLPDACAVLYTYDPSRGAIDPVSRVAAGPNVAALTGDHPRESGLGMTALRERRRVLSYEKPTLTIHPAKQAAGARTVACLPLLIAEEPVGVLYVYLTEARALEPWELLLLDNFVNQAALALYHAGQFSRVRRRLARKEDELALLHRAGLLISSRSRLEDTLEAILEMALEVTGARYGIFRLVDRARQQLVMRAIAGDRLGRPATEALPIDGTSIMGWVAMTRQPLNIPDVRQPPWSEIYYPLDRALQMRSDLAVPLIGAGGRLEGVLNLESPEVAAFSEADSHLLQALANHAVIAIQEVRLLDGLRKTTERLLTQDVQTVLAHLVELACDLVNASAGALWAADREGLALAAASPHYRSDTDRELVQRALETGSLLVYESSQNVGTGTTSPPSYTLVAPVPGVKGRDPAAALVIHLQADQAPEQSTIRETFGRDTGSSEWDKKVLSILAHYAGLALTAATQRQALAQAQEARAVAETFAALGDVAANVLHHLNNKVGTIPVRIEGIQDKCAEALAANPYLAANLAEIERAALEALSAVRERLSLLQPIEVGPVSVADCVADALAQAQLPTGIEVTADGLEALPPVIAGRKTLALVLVNLLENAAEAMSGCGRVRIAGRADAGWVELSVRDDGPGIPPALQARIFEFNFSRARGRTPPGDRPARSKLGFGLWWVKTAMARLGGAVTVESNGQDGATFLLRLPVTRMGA
ncbi:MAG: GAF domain-containing sensor histidine kinase [Anaerolineae bacterium]|nr:GAF domain-containing sensor histidine kinase [Anaerolineae bacterium]